MFARYGVLDFAFVLRRSDGSAEGGWEAGDGTDPIDDHNRQNLILAELVRLQDSLLEHKRAKKTKIVKTGNR